MTRALLISTYDLGHQPFGLASPAAWLAREGVVVECADLTKQRLEDEAVRRADLIGFHLPMHTATRMAAPVIRKVRRANPEARICAYGLYAPLNADWLRSLGVDDVLGGEFESALAEIARSGSPSAGGGEQEGGGEQRDDARPLPRLQFLVPDRRTLPALSRYARLELGDGTTRTAGYTEASRGCRHLCRHCPIVPVYNGQFRIVQADVVLADVAAQAAAGAEHITFGDPDFFNGPTHALRIVERMHRELPALSYDVTIKVEHLLKHRHLLARLRDSGCLFVTSAVESIDDRVLAILDKGHTRADFEEAVAVCRDAGLALAPTFVAFTPWVTLDGYCELLDAIARLDLVGHVAPIQLAIRLLLPSGSKLLDVPEMQPFVSSFDAGSLTYRWRHPDARVDQLQADVSALVGRQLTSQRGELFEAIRRLAFERAGRPAPEPLPAGTVRAVPQMNEPWYCCAEPNAEQIRLV